ncbi:MAG: ATP-binding cassette domain-containing protein [Candidatus Marsarchaeota archaeon]|nr:ATP-binding cassette domain-containing protein [Candidatus Marsarchaeota archaeon]
MEGNKAIEVSGLYKGFKSYSTMHGKKVFLASLRRKYFYKKALENVSFSVDKGELVALLGENGAGKSTMIKILTGILKEDKGNVSVLGMVPWKNRIELDRRIGVVFGKQYSLYWSLPAIDTFEFIKKLYRIKDSDYRKRLDYLVSILNLEDVHKRQVRTMSLGERIKCNFIASVLHMPEIIFLDEPTIGTDLRSSIGLRKAVLDMQKRYGTTVILSTHIVDDIEALGQRVIMLDNGKKVFDGPQEKLKRAFGEKKQIEIYFAEGVVTAAFKSRWNVVDQRDNYIKLEVNPKDLKKKIVSELLSSPDVLDYNVSSPDLAYVLGKFYSSMSKKKGNQAKKGA